MEKVPDRPVGGCWKWGAVVHTRTGYGRFWLDGRQALAHRVAYELFVGPIPAGLQIDHLCMVRDCVNPDHLEPVTARTNTLRSNVARGEGSAVTHCPKGHPYAGDNLYLNPNRGNRRGCKACRLVAGTARRGR